MPIRRSTQSTLRTRGARLKIGRGSTAELGAHMKKTISYVMIVVGVGLLVFGFSAYVPAGSEEFAGWSESCRYVMAAGAMLAVGGWRLP